MVLLEDTGFSKSLHLWVNTIPNFNPHLACLWQVFHRIL